MHAVGHTLYLGLFRLIFLADQTMTPRKRVHPRPSLFRRLCLTPSERENRQFPEI